MATKRKEKEIVEKLKEIGVTRSRLKITFNQVIETYNRTFDKFMIEDAILKYEESQLVRDLERMK